MKFLDSAPLEAAIIGRIAQGDVGAVGDLYDRYCNSLYSLVFTILSDSAETEAVIEEVFLKIWQKAESFVESKGEPLGWAVAITRSHAIDRFRARRHHAMGERLGTMIETTTDIQPTERMSACEFKESGSELRGAFDTQRRAVELAFFGGLSHIEIAEVLQEPLFVIEARIQSGILFLRHALEFKAPSEREPSAGNHLLVITS